MSKSDTYEYDFLRLTFNGLPITSMAATAGTTTIWWSLHTADPGDSGTTAAEGGYTAYTRVGVARTTGGHVVTSGSSAAAASMSPVAAISFPAVATTSTGTFTHAAAWISSAAGSSGMLYSGTVTPNINFGSGVTPSLTTGSSITET